MRAAVIGQPISHSRSPALHRAAYTQLAIGCGYEAIEVAPAQLEAFVDGLRGDRDWAGLSVTMPHKAAMVPLMDAATDAVRALGVLNTVTFGDGVLVPRLTGHNTDVAGVANALRNAGAGLPASAVVVGGGGTAAAALAGLQLLGATRAEIFVRNPGRAAQLQLIGAALGLAAVVKPLAGLAEAVVGADVIVSTLPPRAADPIAAELAAARVRVDGILLDVAYDPWPSALAASWAHGGGTVVSGLEMLLYQAVEQVRLFHPSASLAPDVINVMCDAVGIPRR